MSSTHHIPFPKTFLSLNSPHKRSDSAGSTGSVSSTEEQHNFLSNRPVLPRQASISSASGSDAVSEPATPPTAPVVTKQDVPSFLPLNLKHAAAKVPVKEGAVDKGAFLSNSH